MAALVGVGLLMGPAGVLGQGLFERVGVKAGPSWTAAPVDGAGSGSTRHADRVRSVFLALEPAGRVGPVGAVLELGYVERSGPPLYSLYLVTPDGPTSTTGETTRYGFASVAPLARVRLTDGPVRVYALAGPRANVDLGGNLAGVREVIMEVTGGVGVELPAGLPVFVELRGSLGLTDLSLNGDGVRTRALDLLLGVGARGRDDAALRPGFIRRVGLKSGVTWGTTAARPLEMSAPGRLFWPFWSGLLAVETRALAGPVAGVLELGFVQRGYARDQHGADPPIQAHKWVSPSVAVLARAALLEGAAGTVYALAGPRANTAGAEEGQDDVQIELTAGVGFAPRGIPAFVEARASTSLTDAVPDPDPRWPGIHDAGSYARALDLFIGLVLIDG